MKRIDLTTLTFAAEDLSSIVQELVKRASYYDDIKDKCLSTGDKNGYEANHNLSNLCLAIATAIARAGQ